MKDQKVAVVGMGYWGRNLVRNFHTLDALSVVCDSQGDRERAVQELYPGVAFCTDYQAVLADSAIDAIALATPAVTHYQMARQALEAGKDVYVEKPLAIKTDEGRELTALAKARQRILMVGHILQYHSAVLKLKELVDAGALGQIRYIYSNRLNIGKIRTEENILWSFAPHDISVILGLLGEMPSRISCRGGAYLSPSVADVTVSQLDFPGGVQAHVFVSWLHPFKEQRLVVVGSEQMAVFDDTVEDKLVLFSHKVEWKDRAPAAVKAEGEVVPLDDCEPLQAECRHFLECCRDRRQPRTDGEEGVRVLQVLDLCQQSMHQQGAPIELAETGDKPDFYVHPTACVDSPCQIGAGAKVWHFSHVMKGASLGVGCNLGQNVFVGQDVQIGARVKIQNNVSIYTGVEIEDDVFLGPSCVLTNVSNPRAQVSRQSLYEKTVVRRGATIGANATVVCGVDIGRYAFIGAGALVTHDVPDYALMLGSPARQQGWMSRHAQRLDKPDDEGIMVCPESGYRYRQVEPGMLRCLDLNEDDPLPTDKATGNKPYRVYSPRQGTAD